MEPWVGLGVLKTPFYVALSFVLLTFPSVVMARELMTEQEALKQVLKAGEQATAINWKGLNRELKRQVKHESGQRFRSSWTHCFQAQKKGKVTAYLCVDNMIGKTAPITYLARIAHPSGEIQQLKLLVYRESVGSEIGHPLFFAQFYGRKAGDPMTLHQDIQAISGATYSSRGLNRGVKKLQWIYRLYLVGLDAR